jgi:uroporphyrinogen decarboxylase
MTPRQRLLTAIRNEQPDHVPAAPDLYEMAPIKLLGRPSWEMLVYQDPPVWKARMDTCAHFGVDAFIPLWVPLEVSTNTAVVFRDDDRLITRTFLDKEGRRTWSPFAMVYMRDDASAYVKAATISLPEEHEDFEIVLPNYNKVGREHFEDARKYAGEQGVVAPMVCLPALSTWPEDTYAYLEEPDTVRARMQQTGEWMMKTAEEILSWNPDVLLIGNSGMMITNPPHVFRDLGLEWLEKLTRLAKERNIPTHIHCCGPEKALVEIAATETDLAAIEPLEIPPMGDCDLAEIKQRFGHRLALKGNLHTTRVMLMGTPAEVEEACKRAIDDAAAGGGFILSTGDQTPRDTPEENIVTMQHVAETYGRY